MPVEKIIDKIKKNAEEKKESIMDRAEEKMEEVKDEIREEKERKIDEIKKKKEREIQTIQNRIISQAKLEKRKKVLNEREKIIDQVFNEAKEKIRDMEPEEYENYLKDALKRSVNILSEEAVLHCNSENVDKIKQIADELDLSNKIEGDLITIGGIKAVSKDGSKIDLTFEANLERKKRDLRKEVSNILFLED